MYVYIHIYIYIGFREGYIKLDILIIRQTNNFPQLSNIKLCVVRHIFIAAGARHGYATWRKVEGGDGAVTWLVLLNNTQLVGSWDMIPLMALVDGFLPNHLKHMRKSNWIIPQVGRGENSKKSLSCHHVDVHCINWFGPKICPSRACKNAENPILETMMEKFSNKLMVSLNRTSYQHFFIPLPKLSNNLSRKITRPASTVSTAPFLSLCISKFKHNHMPHLPPTAYAYHGLVLHPCAHDHPDHCGHHVHHDHCGDLDLFVVAKSPQLHRQMNM